MKKYITGSGRWKVEAKITEIEVERESDTSIWVNGKRRQKVTDYEIVHDTWDAAHSYLLATGETKVAHARRTLEEHKSYLGNVKGMKRPGAK